MVTLRESASDASGPTVRNLSSDCESVLPGNQGDEIRDMKTDDVPLTNLCESNKQSDLWVIPYFVGGSQFQPTSKKGVT